LNQTSHKTPGQPLQHEQQTKELASIVPGEPAAPEPAAASCYYTRGWLSRSTEVDQTDKIKKNLSNKTVKLIQIFLRFKNLFLVHRNLKVVHI